MTTTLLALVTALVLQTQTGPAAPPPPTDQVDGEVAPPLPPDRPSGATMPVTLQQCIYLAEKNSLPLRLDEIDVQIAKATVGQELGTFDTVAFFSAEWFKAINPSASVLEGGFGSVQIVGLETKGWNVDSGFRGNLLSGGSYQADMTFNETDRNPAPFSVINPTYGSTVGASVTQPLLRGFGTTIAKSGVLKAQNAMLGAAESLEASRVLRAGEVLTAYWDFYFALETVDVRTEDLALSDERVRQNQRRYEVGDIKKVDVTDALAQQADSRRGLLTAQSQIGRTADALKRLIFPFDDRSQWEVELIPVTEYTVDPVEPPTWSAAARIALERRPELRAQREFLKNNDIDLVVAENALLPALDMIGSLRFNQLAASRGDVFDYDGDIYSITGGVQFEMPLGNRTARYGLSIARLQKTRALVAYKDTENSIIEQVRNAVRDVVDLLAEYEAALQAEQLNRRQFEEEQRRFDVGYSTSFQVEEAQQDMLNAVLLKNEALKNYQIAVAALSAAQGTLLEDYGILPSPTPKLEDRAGVLFD